jgi:uncharacterized RDD family membrane protein YckC
MNWFYAEGSQQKGPVNEPDLAALVRQGVVKPETLVWREGLPDWQPVSTARPDLIPAAGTPVIAGMAVPEQNKDLLIQQMREGVLEERSMPGAMQYVGFWWRVLARIIDGLVVAAAGCVFAMPIAFIFGMAGASSAANGTPDPAMQLVSQGITQIISWAVSATYFTWMTGRFGATLGKQALGFKVVTEDGGKVSYLRAFGRWAADNLLSGTIYVIVIAIPVVLVVVLGVGGFDKLFEKGNEAALGGWFFALFVAAMVGGLVGAFPWWMCAFDSEKRTLHDRVCATRVIRK